MIGLIIYLVGSVLAYRRMRKTWISNFDDEASWGRVGSCFLASIISWLGFLLAVVLDDDVKPPKWL